LIQDAGILAYSLHPGAVSTDIPRNLAWPWSTLFMTLAALFFKTPRKGAQTSVFACVDPLLEAHSGAYLMDCSISKVCSDAKSIFACDKNSNDETIHFSFGAQAGLSTRSGSRIGQEILGNVREIDRHKMVKLISRHLMISKCWRS
jgi:hypothetical protein